MFKTNGQIELKIGSSTNLLSPETFHHRQHVVYLTNPPYLNDQPFLDSFTILFFLGTFDDKDFRFSKCKKSLKTINGEEFTNYINVSYHQLKLFKIRFQQSGNHFVIQVTNLDECIKYNKSEIKKKRKVRTVYIFNRKPISCQNSESPIQIQSNKGISYLSQFYNNKNVDRNNQNQITANLFYSVSPFDVKTVKRKKNAVLNPDNSVEGSLKNFGGMLIKFEPKETIDLNEYPLGIFTWFSPYFDQIVDSWQFNRATTIELDGTFTALAPYVICVPQLIFRNSGIPLGLMISISESASLYSIFFEALKKLDEVYQNSENDSLFQKFKKKNYLTDEHKAFLKLSKKYNLDLYYCFVHLIRSIGANSLLGFLLSDLLYTFSEEDWSKNEDQNFYLFKYLYEAQGKKDDESRFAKVSEVLGRDVEGNKIPTNHSYSPLFLRYADNIPATTNHIEAFHRHLNEITKGAGGNLFLRLSYTCKYIIDRTQRVDKSSRSNLKKYLKNIRQKAEKATSNNKSLKNKFTKEACTCYRKLYYQRLFWNQVPCIHEILNTDPEIDSLYIDNYFQSDFDFQILDQIQSQLQIFSVQTDLKFKKKKNANKIFNDGPPINMNYQEIFEDDPLKLLIRRTELRFSKMLADANQNLTDIALKLQSELLDQEEYREMKKRNRDEYFALFQVQLWERIIDGKKGISI